MTVTEFALTPLCIEVHKVCVYNSEVKTSILVILPSKMMNFHTNFHLLVLRLNKTFLVSRPIGISYGLSLNQAELESYEVNIN